MNTAIIGLGHIGSCVARNLAADGVDILIADRTLAKAEKLAGELGDRTIALPVEAAIGRADVLILTVSFGAIKELLAQHRGALAGKIIVDPSNPIEPDGKGGFRKTIPQDQSSGQIIAGLLPEGAVAVKAFGTLGAASLASAANRLPERAVLSLRDRQSGCRQDRGRADHRERLHARPRRRHRPFAAARGRRRPS